MPVLLGELVMDEAEESDAWHGVLVEDFTRIKTLEIVLHSFDQLWAQLRSKRLMPGCLW